MASVCFTFLGAALGHLVETEPQSVELVGEGFNAGHLFVAVALAGDQLAAGFGRGPQRRVVWKVGSVGIWSFTMSLMSSSSRGR